MHVSTSSITGAATVTSTSRTTTSHYSPGVPPQEVVARLTDQLQRGADTGLTRLLRARAYVQLHDYASACTDLDGWIRDASPGRTCAAASADTSLDQFTDALFYRGVCRARLTMVDEAVGDFTAVLQRAPTHQRAQYERAACHARLGDFAAAIADYETALRLDEVGREKENWRCHRQRRHEHTPQSRALAASSSSAHPRTSPTPQSSACTAAAPAETSQLTFQPSLSGVTADVAPLSSLANPLAAENASPRSPSSASALAASSVPRTPQDVATDSVAAAVSVSDFTVPALSVATRSLSAVLGRRGSGARHEGNANEDDLLSGVSSSTASSRGGSASRVPVAAAAPVPSPPRTLDASAGSYSPRRENPESGLELLPAMDPTCVLSSCSSDDEDDDAAFLSGVSFDDAASGSTGPSPAGSPLLSANAFYQRGLQYRRRGELTAAVEMYTEALRLSPSHFKALFNRAFCHDKLSQYDLAVDDYRAALELDPRNPFTYYNLGISYDHRGCHARAVHAFSRAIELDGRHPDFFHNRGFTQRKQGAFAAAIADYTAAIALDPKHFKSHYNRAYCYSKLGRYAEAVADYTAALQIDCGNPNAYHNRGAVLEKLGRHEEAVKDFTRALQRDPKLTFSLNARGLVYDYMRQYDKALADFSAAIRLDPRNAAWLHNRGYTYRNMSELELAIADYTASLKLAPHSHTAYNNRAFAFRKLGRYEAAIEDYTKALRELPASSPKVLNNRAYCFARLNLFEDAIRDYTEVLACDANDAHALYNRGISFEKCGKYNAAVDDFSRVIHLAPEATATANAYFSRGTSRMQLQQVPAATEDLRKALRLDLMACGLRGGALKAYQAEHPAWRLLRDLGAT